MNGVRTLNKKLLLAGATIILLAIVTIVVAYNTYRPAKVWYLSLVKDHGGTRVYTMNTDDGGVWKFYIHKKPLSLHTHALIVCEHPSSLERPEMNRFCFAVTNAYRRLRTQGMTQREICERRMIKRQTTLLSRPARWSWLGN